MPGDEVQMLLIQQAQGHFAEGRYEVSIRILRRVVESYPQSPRQAEARWWLARSYEQARQIRARVARGSWECWAVRTLTGPAVRFRGEARPARAVR